MLFLDEAEDLEWLSEQHGVNVEGAVCAVLDGNEDAPAAVYVYDENDWRTNPVRVYRADREFTLRRII